MTHVPAALLSPKPSPLGDASVSGHDEVQAAAASAGPSTRTPSGLLTDAAGLPDRWRFLGVEGRKVS